MDSEDIVNSILIILIFAIINIVSILGIGIAQIKNNWNEYKCMPMIIPLSGIVGPPGSSPEKTFTECIKNIQGNFISDMLGPVYTVFDKMNNIGEELGKFISMANGMTNIFQGSFLDGTISIVGMISKISLGVTTMGIKLKDMINKLVGIFLTVLYILLGLNITTVSIWNGLPGQLVRTVEHAAASL
jgi:hypothetical protein